MDSIKIGTEVPVSVLTQAIVNSKPRLAGVLQDPQLQKIAANSQDRIDLVIECEIKSEDIKAKKLQIIIENKIDSSEGGKNTNKITGVPAYDDASQTTRYYLGTKFSSIEYGVGTKEECDGLETLQLYVYLTPESQQSAAGIDNHFIKISYQDIVDGILMPMLSSSNLSSDRRHYMEVVTDFLTHPYLDGNATNPNNDIVEELPEELLSVWKDYRSLLIDSAIVTADPSLFSEEMPRQSIELLSAFGNKNRQFLTAIFNGMNPDDLQKEELLLVEAYYRDTTKYNVYYQDRCLNRRPLGKAETVLCIIKLWSKLHDNDITLQDLRDTFPVSYNPYYANGQWYEHLFYLDGDSHYDGPNGDGSVPTSKWNIDAKKYFIDTKDGKVIFLKMWRKDGLEHFIQAVDDAKLFTDGALNVVPVD